MVERILHQMTIPAGVKLSGYFEWRCWCSVCAKSMGSWRYRVARINSWYIMSPRTLSTLSYFMCVCVHQCTCISCIRAVFRFPRPFKLRSSGLSRAISTKKNGSMENFACDIKTFKDVLELREG